MQLGKGTSQHVLVSGKTGSGKSTLLHVLIVNLALRYSPDEAELYLVDFKKGVEFKAYAEAGLPHARIIAIESEREFGLSVLERLDAELRDRGDLFRQRGVQDIQAFRAAEPDARMPRVLLVIDEFQELFVEDDRIAQNAMLLLDRLVRQGRAFGIHVLLGSQTLAGAYSIPRATIGQMAVRIALQCSESDAHLILSEENTAARLLSRPGEAIYNDANGLYEGNHPFQIVWLSDKQREDYLGRLAQWADTHGHACPPAIVFEGNQPADPAKNAALCELIASPSWSKPSPAGRAWVGSPVAIRDPIAAVFARQGGANLLIAGHQEDTALGILATAMIGLAAQYPPSGPESGPGAKFYVLDGMRPDAAHAGLWNRLAAALPHALTIVSPREAPGVIAEISEELARREQPGQEYGPPVYLIVYDLGRFRDLRKREDDFGFPRDDDTSRKDPARQFRNILHEGPAVGIHALMWGDSYNSVTRVLDRHALDDVDLRVLFRMNAGDSSSLIDTPAASLLGVFRAIFDDKGQGLSEKFRPYGPPNQDWLDWVASQLKARGPARK
jgi:energy-coupling factor transporter ATP-binding protein EcfA2